MGGVRVKPLLASAVAACIAATFPASVVQAQLNDSEQKIYDAVLKKLQAELVHYVSVAADDSAAPDGTNWKNDGARNPDAVAIGKAAVARGNGSIALGLEAETGSEGLALNAQHAADAVAIGTRAKSRGKESIAIGKDAQSDGQAVVIGSEARTNTTDPQAAVVIGKSAYTEKGSAVVIGGNARDSGGSSVAIGVRSEVKGHGGVAIGGVGSLLRPIGVTGSGYLPGAMAVGQTSVAVGAQALSSGDSAIALGLVAHAAGENALAVGQASYAGTLAHAKGYKARALGTGSYAEGCYTVATGYGGVAVGAQAVNVGTPVFENGAIKDHLGYGISLGGQTYSGGYGTALGYRALSAGQESVAIGAASTVARADLSDRVIQNKLDTDAAFKQTIETAYAGELSKFHSDDRNRRKALLAFGREYLHAQAGALRGVAIGTSTVTSAPYGVALGAWSEAHREGFTKETIAPYSQTDLKDITLGAVSVGLTLNDKPLLRQITHVGDATEDTDAVNLRQLRAVADRIGQPGGTSGGDTPPDVTVGADTGASFKLGQSLYVKGDGRNITTSTVGTDTVKVALNDDIDIKSSVSVGGNTYITQKGINANGQTVTNVKDGEVSETSMDAINGSQLYRVQKSVQQTSNEIAELRDESRRGDAMTAALAALKPLDFDPYQRSQVMAGIGHSNGKEAVALGLAHYTNEDTMIHAGVSYGGSSEWAANAGVTWRFGDADDHDLLERRRESMPQYAAGPISSVYVLQDEVMSLKAENAALKVENEDIRKENEDIRRELDRVMRHIGLTV